MAVEMRGDYMLTAAAEAAKSADVSALLSITDVTRSITSDGTLTLPLVSATTNGAPAVGAAAIGVTTVLSAQGRSIRARGQGSRACSQTRCADGPSVQLAAARMNARVVVGEALAALKATFVAGFGCLACNLAALVLRRRSCQGSPRQLLQRRHLYQLWLPASLPAKLTQTLIARCWRPSAFWLAYHCGRSMQQLHREW